MNSESGVLGALSRSGGREHRLGRTVQVGTLVHIVKDNPEIPAFPGEEY